MLDKIKFVVRALGKGLYNSDLEIFAHRFVISDRADSELARTTYDFFRYRRANFGANQALIIISHLIGLNLVSFTNVAISFIIFQTFEFIMLYSVGAQLFQLKEFKYEVRYWSRFRYILNLTQFTLQILALTYVAFIIPLKYLAVSGTAFLLLMVLSSTLNFFSARFNLFCLIYQLGLFFIVSALTISIREITVDVTRDFYYLIPVLMAFLAAHTGVSAYSEYYSHSIQQERISFLVQQKLVLNAQEASKERHLMESILTAVTEAIVVVDDNGYVLRANPAFGRFFDVSVNQLDGLKISNIINSKYLMTDSRQRSFEMSDDRHYLIQGTTLHLTGESDLCLYIIVDVSEKTKDDQIAMHSQKLKALGTLSGGIAHDFHNALAVIRANADLINESDDLDTIKNEYLNDITLSVDTATGLTRQILAFARNAPMQANRVDPQNILFETGRLVQNLISPTHSLETVCETKGAAICDRVLLKNSLLNLIINARDAMKSGGTIVLKAMDDAEKKRIVFCVEDSGEGISKKLLDKVIEPFISLKPNEKGTGIGLAMVKQFAERSNGKFELSSRLGVGTEARLILPRTDKEKNQRELKPVKPNKEINVPLKILVVDDNAILAKSIKSQLIISGHHAETAISLDTVSAIEDLDSFDLVVCDVVLVAETGLDIYRYFQSNGLKTKFLFISGNISPNLREEVAQVDCCRLLEKPFGKEQLLNEIENIMSSALEES